MSFVDGRVEELRTIGVFGAQQVDSDTIHRILNMQEWEYYELEVVMIESYLGLLAQQVYFLQQECNIADAKEIEYGNDFKRKALPEVVGSKIRSVDERWIAASLISEELAELYDRWQQSIIDATLKKKLSDPITEKLNVLKKIYDDRRLEGRNKNLHKIQSGEGR
jgi:hypothetical protein